MAARKKKSAGHGAGKLILFLLVLCVALLLRFGQGQPLRRAREAIQIAAGQQLEHLDYEAAAEAFSRGFAQMTQKDGTLADVGRRLLGLKSGNGSEKSDSGF